MRWARWLSPAIVALLVMGILGAAVHGLQPRRRAPAAGVQHVVGPTGPFTTAPSNAVAPTSAATHAGRAPKGSGGQIEITAAASALPAPSGQLPPVAPVSAPREVDAVVTLPGTVTDAEIQALTHTQGIAAIEEVDTGTVQLAGAPVVTFGVDPGTFRNFTPTPSADDNALWQYIAGGAVASSYDMASDRKLPLGARLPITPAGNQRPTSGWVGAFVSIGIPGVDMVVDNDESQALGLDHNGGLLISAPQMDPTLLGTTLRQDLAGANVDVTSPQLVAAATDPVTGAAVPAPTPTIATVINAALSRIGDPYVWGGTGPKDFDCSGLVGWAFAQAGVAMPRTAAQQALAGTPITYAEAQPGDLLFWHYDPSDPTFIDHVAIYLGNNMMVVAPHTGTDVEVTQVPLADMAAVVRVVPAIAAQVGGYRFS